jgi:hypothetical protein
VPEVTRAHHPGGVRHHPAGIVGVSITDLDSGYERAYDVGA